MRIPTTTRATAHHYLFSAGYSDKIDNEWRLLMNADAVLSDSDQSSLLDGDYLEASAGLAYRPSTMTSGMRCSSIPSSTTCRGLIRWLTPPPHTLGPPSAAMC